MCRLLHDLHEAVGGIISMACRAKAYADSRAAAERNRRLVAEQEGLYYPASQGAADPQMFRWVGTQLEIRCALLSPV